MTPKGEKKPDEYADAFASHTQPELLKIHDPRRSAAHPVIKATDALPPASRKRTETTSTGCAVVSQENAQAGCQNCHAADMSGQRRCPVADHQQRQRPLPTERLHGLPPLQGYDEEPEELNSIGQQIKQIETQKIKI